MPYRFKIDEPVEKGFRRIAREQVEAALAELAAEEIKPTGVHECRKALKRLRALIRLAGPAIGDGKARRQIKALGEIAGLLSERRDQAVMLQTLGKLAADGGPAAADLLAPLRAHLVGRSGEEAEPLDRVRAAQARLRLLREAKKLSHTRFRRRGFAALEGGLQKCYRQGRKALKDAYNEPTDEAFHSLRKAVQWHWRQMSLLARAWPEEFAVRVAAARELSQMLGDDHDLALLTGAAISVEDLSEESKEAIVALCQRRQRHLRAAAEHRASRLFAETPKAFIKRMRAYWQFGREIDVRFEVQPAAHPEPHLVLPAGHAAAEAEPAPPAAKSVASKPKLAATTAAQPASQRRA
jgi:CHAD domain-containing protein